MLVAQMVSDFRRAMYSYHIRIGFVIVVVGSTALCLLLAYAGTSLERSPVSIDDADGRRLVASAFFSLGYPVFAYIGVVFAAREYGSLQVCVTLSANPRRVGVAISRIIVSGVVGLVFGLTVSVASYAAIFGVLLAQGGSGMMGLGELATGVLAISVAVTLWVIFGTCLGVVFRGVLTPVLGISVWAMVIEPVVRVLGGGIGAWLPGSVTEGMAGGGIVDSAFASGSLSQSVSLCVGVCAVLVLCCVALTRFRRLDVSRL